MKIKRATICGVAMAAFVVAEPALELKCLDASEEHPCHSLVEHFMPHDHSEHSEVVATTTVAMSVSGGASTQHYGYQLELRCPDCRKSIGHIFDWPVETLSLAEAQRIFANDDLWCQCGWNGKVRQLQPIRIGRNAWLPA